MSFRDTVAQDYLIVDGLECVTYLSPRGVKFIVENVDAHEYAAHEAAVLGGFVGVGDMRFSIPCELIEDLRDYPRPGGGVIRENGSRYQIVGDCTRDQFHITWIVNCARAAGQTLNEV